MKKQVNLTTKAHSHRSALYFFLLLGVCAISFALAQQNNTESAAPPVAVPDAALNMSPPKADSSVSGTVRTVPAPPQSQLPEVAGNSITTIFASNNFSSLGGANYFDLTVGTNSIVVTALDINTATAAAFTNLRVYVLPGMTSVGHETNMALWTQVATGSGTGVGVDQPTHVTLSNPIPLLAGTLY